MNVSLVMTPCPHRVSADTPLMEALEIMGNLGIRHLPVIGESEVLGVITEQDARLTASVCKALDTVVPASPRAKDVCTPVPLIVSDKSDVARVARQMAEQRVDCALVADDEGSLVGIFTTTDVCDLLCRLLEKQSDCADL